ncbi:MAG: hypothetical protein AAFP99_03170 [Pseudomonadota bacterium]
MLTLIPLMIVPFIAYNVMMIASPDIAPWSSAIGSFTMISGGTWTMTIGDVILVAALFCLFIEILKSTRTSNASVVDHLLSTFVFVAFLVEFIVVPGAATSVFFLCMIMALIDLMAGFSVSIRSAGRDVSFN